MPVYTQLQTGLHRNAFRVPVRFIVVELSAHLFERAEIALEHTKSSACSTFKNVLYLDRTAVCDPVQATAMHL